VLRSIPLLPGPDVTRVSWLAPAEFLQLRIDEGSKDRQGQNVMLEVGDVADPIPP